jgi:hypothetical protein
MKTHTSTGASHPFKHSDLPLPIRGRTSATSRSSWYLSSPTCQVHLLGFQGWGIIG